MWLTPWAEWYKYTQILKIHILLTKSHVVQITRREQFLCIGGLAGVEKLKLCCNAGPKTLNIRHLIFVWN